MTDAERNDSWNRSGLRDITPFPNGRDWECWRCKRTYPEGFEDQCCIDCGVVLTRVTLTMRYRP